MTTEHCHDIQNYIATKNARKHWKECCDIKNDCCDKIDGRRLDVSLDSYTFGWDKSW